MRRDNVREGRDEMEAIRRKTQDTRERNMLFDLSVPLMTEQ